MRILVLALLSAAMLNAQQPTERSTLDQAWKLTAQGERGEAIHLLETLIVTNPRSTDARLLLGSLLMEDGE